MSNLVKSTDDVSMAVDELLQRKSAYLERPTNIEVRETHLSKVFLTDTRAYKLKKAVHFDFADFSTPELRREACEDELRLNRRLAPDVYLAVVPITLERSGRVQIEGKGEPVDWLVKMRRLPDDRSLKAMIGSGCVTADEVRRIAERLTAFYQELPPLFVRPGSYRREINEHIAANRETLLDAPHHFAADVVKRVHTAQVAYLHALAARFDERVCDGRIVEGHGDLRPEHIYFMGDPIVIDCVEFNTGFRQLDVLDELGFLAMECRALGAASIGNDILEYYKKESGDHAPQSLLAFYMTYRACVRAKVSLLRSMQVGGLQQAAAMVEAARYLDLAEELAEPIMAPVVVIMRGLSGVGKTTLARPLAETLGAEYLQTDAVRLELLGPATGESGYNEGRYSRDNQRRVYDQLFERAEQLVKRGLSVVLDGTFLARSRQAAAVELARRHGAQPLIVQCQCAADVAANRIDQRTKGGTSLSEALPQIHQLQREEQEAPLEDVPQCEVDTDCAESLMIKTTLGALRQACQMDSDD